MAVNLKVLKENLLSSESNFDANKVMKAIAYLSDPKLSNTLNKHDGGQMYSLVAKYLNAGTNLDGVNVVLSGFNMGLITYQGYLNKVKLLHPGVFFDVQMVREGDTFKFEKTEDGVKYNHDIGDPFANYEDKKIIGAYCVIKLPDGNSSLELLNIRDYDEMKNSSRTPSTWNQWPSEFWRKSVVKRACKLYFSEEIAELEKIDNEDYGIGERATKQKVNDDISDAVLNAIVDGA